MLRQSLVLCDVAHSKSRNARTSMLKCGVRRTSRTGGKVEVVVTATTAGVATNRAGSSRLSD